MSTTETWYPYDYFSGANVIVQLNDQPIFECAGISYNEVDSQQPIYGYSSRLFDAVAPGQKIIQGKFVVNMVDGDYVYDSMNETRFPQSMVSLAQDRKAIAQSLTQSYGTNTPDEAQMEALENAYWRGLSETYEEEYEGITDPSIAGKVDIKIDFARRFSIILLDCHIIGRSAVIQIDENVIVEEFAFFGRSSIVRSV